MDTDRFFPNSGSSPTLSGDRQTQPGRRRRVRLRPNGQRSLQSTGLSLLRIPIVMNESESSRRVKHYQKSVDSMNNTIDQTGDDDIPEMDLSGGVRGKYYARYMSGTNVVLLEPDMAQVFHDSAVVNQALREYLSEHGAPPDLPKRSD